MRSPLSGVPDDLPGPDRVREARRAVTLRIENEILAAKQQALTQALAEPDRSAALRVAARKTAIARYDLRRVCLPRMVAFVEGIAA